MKHTEEELQRRIESGNLQGLEDADIKVYQQLFNSLKKEPEFELPYGFADKVVRKAMETKKNKSAVGEYFWLGAGIVVLLLAAIITITMTHYTFDLGFLKGLRSYKGVLVFGAAFILLLNILEKKLNRQKDVA